MVSDERQALCSKLFIFNGLKRRAGDGKSVSNSDVEFDRATVTGGFGSFRRATRGAGAGAPRH